jgi:serine/threonine protein phosphatase 1
VQAGLNFNNDDILADQDAMMWERGFDNFQSKLGNKILVHGHTPISLTQVLTQKGNCINIDNGCVYDKLEKGYGNLVAYICETGEYEYVPKCD